MQVVQQVLFAPLCRAVAVCYVLAWDALVHTEVHKTAAKKH
jgi:hypothetical protein